LDSEKFRYFSFKYLLKKFKKIKIQNDLGHQRQRQPEQPYNAEPQTRQIDDSILNLEDVPGSSNWTNRDYLTRYHQ